jgi:Domain of unknown function (DUF4279)
MNAMPISASRVLSKPAEITSRVGISPARTSLEGESIPGTNTKKKCSRWALHSRLERTAALQMHISDVLEQLDKNELGFRQVSEEFGGVMELVGQFRAYYPGLFLESQIVGRLAYYGLSVDCDFYFPDPSQS